MKRRIFAGQQQFLVLVVISILVVMSSSGTTLGQIRPPEIEWESSYGGERTDDPKSVRQSSRGGYVVAGDTMDLRPPSPSDASLLRIDRDGNLAWEKRFGRTRIAHSGRFRSILLVVTGPWERTES